MSEESEVNTEETVSQDNNLNSIKVKSQPMYLQITITFGLILGPILLILLAIWPNLLSSIPLAFEISLIITLLFVLIAILNAYRNERSTPQ